MFSDAIYRLRALFRRGRLDAELDEEIRLHVEREAEAYVQAGVTPEEAKRRARLALGGEEQVKEACRDARGVARIEALIQDIRYGARVLRKSPGYTAAAVLTLALGMGANTAIFTLVNGVLLRPLPVREPGRLVTVNQKVRDRVLPFISLGEFRQIQLRPQLFERACAFQTQALNLSRRGQVDNAWGLLVTGGYFDTLGVPAILGRALSEADDRPGGGPDGPAAVISYRFWQARFGGAADVVGRSLHIERTPYTIVGVMPPGFHGTGPFAFDLAIPVATVSRPGQRQDQVDASLYLTLIARLREDQTFASASAELAAAAPGIVAAADGTPREWILVERPTRSGLEAQYRRPLLAMLTLAGLVLLIVCASVANLSLARATARHHEMCVRRALGASRLRLARQALVENVLLAGAGAGLGLLFASWFSPLVARQVATTYRPIWVDLTLDWRILAFTAGAGTAAALLSGLVPAFRASRARPHGSMADGGRGQVGASRMRVNHALVVVQVGLSLALVVAASLFVRTFHTLATLDLGFERDKILVVRVEGEQSQVPAAQRAALNERVREAVAAVPGVARAVSLRTVPVSPDHWVANVEIPGRTPPASGNRTAFLNSVSPGWFAMFGTPVIAGRELDDRDRPGSELVAVVNEAFVRQFAGGHNLVGEALRFGGDDELGPPFKNRRPGPGLRRGHLLRDSRGRATDRLPGLRAAGSRPPELHTAGVVPPGRHGHGRARRAAGSRGDTGHRAGGPRPEDQLPHDGRLRGRDGHAGAPGGGGSGTVRHARARPCRRGSLRRHGPCCRAPAGGDRGAHGARRVAGGRDAGGVEARGRARGDWDRAWRNLELLGVALRGGDAVRPRAARPGDVCGSGHGPRGYRLRRRVATRALGGRHRSGDHAAERVRPWGAGRGGRPWGSRPWGSGLKG